MKVTELQIGDWYTWEAEGKKYPMQVTKETFGLSDKDIAAYEYAMQLYPDDASKFFVAERAFRKGIEHAKTLQFCIEAAVNNLK
jgi:hypothetical protein